MNVRSFLIAATAVLLSSATAMAADSLNAKAGASGLSVAATLASYGSFEWHAAPLYTRVALARRSAATALRKGDVTVGEAEHVQRTADRVRALLDAALKACAQDNRSGKCTGSRENADWFVAVASGKITRLSIDR